MSYLQQCPPSLEWSYLPPSCSLHSELLVACQPAKFEPHTTQTRRAAFGCAKRCCFVVVQGPACVCPPVCGFVMIVRQPGEATYQTPAVCTFDYTETGLIGLPLVINPDPADFLNNKAWVALCGSSSGSGVTTPQFPAPSQPGGFDYNTNSGPTTELGIDCQVATPLPTTDGSCQCPTRVFPNIPPPATP